MYPEAGGCLNGTAIAKRRIMILSLSASPSFLSLASIKYQVSQPMTKHKKNIENPQPTPMMMMMQPNPPYHKVQSKKKANK
jgi:hypothetical protein